jgi:hypothetical protein
LRRRLTFSVLQFVGLRLRMSQQVRAHFLALAGLGTAILLLWWATHSGAAAAAEQDSASTSPAAQAALRGQSVEQTQRKSAGCVSCHTSTDEPTMHPTKTVQLGCTDCHGGKSIRERRSRSDCNFAGIPHNQAKSTCAAEKRYFQKSLGDS